MQFPAVAKRHASYPDGTFVPESTSSSYDPFDGMAMAVSSYRGFGRRTCRQALHESNIALKDFKLGSGDGIRIPADSSGHSYQHIKHRKWRKSK